MIQFWLQTVSILVIVTLMISMIPFIELSAANGKTAIYSDRMIHYKEFTQNDLIAAGSLVVIIGGTIFGQPELTAMGTAQFTQYLSNAHGLGARGDDIVYPSYTLTGKNCIIDRVSLQLVDKTGKILAEGGKDLKYEHNFFTSIGARITESHEGTDNGRVGVHWWYDTGTAVRYIVVYELTGENCGFIDQSGNLIKTAQPLTSPGGAGGGGSIGDKPRTHAN